MQVFVVFRMWYLTFLSYSSSIDIICNREKPLIAFLGFSIYQKISVTYICCYPRTRLLGGLRILAAFRIIIDTAGMAGTINIITINSSRISKAATEDRAAKLSKKSGRLPSP